MNAAAAITEGKMEGKLVYIASPYAGDVEKNTAFAKEACLYAIRQGGAPIAVHLLYPQLLEDSIPDQRQAGLRCGLRLLERCDELWVCGETVSSGMREEICLAEELGIPIRAVSTQEIEAPIHPVHHRQETDLEPWEGDSHTLT